MHTPRALLVLLLPSLLLGLACSYTPPSDGNPLYGTRLWQSYRDAPDHRALAIAGIPDRKWVGGASAGMESLEAARLEALAECGRRRKERRIQAPCVIFAEGNRVVWVAR